MSHQAGRSRPDTHPPRLLDFDPVPGLIWRPPLDISRAGLVCTPRVSSVSSGLSASKRLRGENWPTTTSSSRQLSRHPSIGANQPNRVHPNPTLPGPAHGYINLQSFVSSARQCRQCRHQCNHLLACSLTRSLTLLYLAFHCLHRYKALAYLRACRVQSGQSNLPCYAWRPFRIRSATADPPCCCCCRCCCCRCCCYCCCCSCHWPLAGCFVPSQRPASNPAPTTWNLGSGIGIWDTPSRVIR